MKNLASVALIATTMAVAATPSAVFAAETTQPVQAAADEAASPVEVSRGTMLYSAKGNRIANVYRVNKDGDPQVILNGRLITIPASTLSDEGGKIVTSLTKREIARSR